MAELCHGRILWLWLKRITLNSGVGCAIQQFIQFPSIDVAAVAETLFRLPTVASRLGALAKRDLSDVDVARLGFFIGLHDAGKANHGFQARLQRRKPDCGHIGPVWSVLCGSPVHSSHYLLRKRVRKSLTVSLWRRWNVDWEAEVEIWNAVLAHHGSLPANLSTRSDPSLWQQRDGYDWNGMSAVSPGENFGGAS